MEDEESDMPVSVEGPKEGDKHLEKPQHSNINSEDVTDLEKSICSSKEKNGDIAAADHEDSIKPKLKNTLGVPGDIESETNNSESHSDSDVPLNPKKVNGEVELPKYSEKDENAGNSMDAVSLTKSGVPENEDDTSEHEKRTSRKRKRSVSSNELPESDHSDAGDYKGVKKPARGDVSLTAIKNGSQHNISGEVDPSVKCTSESLKSASIEFPVIITPPTLHDGVESSAQLTEYAQYLGLQPTVKFKCYKCGETGFPSMSVLQEHQNVCFKTLNRSQPIVKPPPTATVEPTPSTNIRITRKVYLCSVCGTYYENWNLFLHIREVHKRHICLFCLGMFAHSDNLVSHLSVRHGVIEESFSSADDFLNEYKDSCFLMCCTCEKLFTERENFFDHNCVEGLSVSVDKACSLCGLKGAHFPTCRQAFTDSDASPPQSTSSVSTPLKCSEDAVQDPPLLLKEQSGKKQATPVNKIAENKDKRKELDVGNVAEGNEKLKDLSDLDDEYDISNAASFCHVNIDETPERNKANVEKDNSVKDNSDKNKTAIETPQIKPAQVENKEDACLEESNVKDNSETTAIVPENDGSKVCEAEQPEQDAADQKNNTEETSLTPDVAESAEEQMESNKDSLEEMPGDLELDKSSTKEDFYCENANLDDTSDKSVHIEEPKAQEQEEPDAKLLLNSESCPKSPPKLEAQTSSKTPSATEAESESESSDSPEETDESSSSSESSDESNHNDDIKKDKMGVTESDIDNADSDKMSLIVDETKSEDEKEMQDEVNTLDEMQTDDVQQTENGDDSMREEINELEIKKETDQGSENENQEAAEEMHEKKEVENRTDDVVENIQLAGEDVPLLELTLEENLDTLTIQTLLKESVKISCLNCVYCNHAKKIAVNGKQLALHLLAEHRFAPVVCSDSGELTEVDGFVDKLKASLLDLQQMYFNTDSYDNMDPNSNCQYDRTYECFHCHFVTTLHKELYVHNRKMHQKTILLCIMCKSNFYSYSELLCHLCPGIYVPESNITFRCCLCTVDGLPSAFRLMVHLRKRHHACDVCLETTGDQQKLSNHVWKHKLHHLCYRCGIAYRNKPDITKHLFWKHGTESVLCKKCLQKKWPHVYHFCIPPNAFVCEECNSTFSRAVALKVHKRIHAGDLPYACDECEERYISRKLLMKHQLKHRDPPAEENMEIKMEENGPSTEAESQKDLRVDAADVTMCDSDEPKEKVADDDGAEQVKLETVDADSDSVIKNEEVLDPDMQDETPTKENAEESQKLDEKETERKSRVVDVYDLPPLNLSSESDDSDEEEKSIQKEEKSAAPETLTQPVAAEKKLEEIDKTSEVFPTEEQPVPIVDGIWDNFKNYKANLERRESQQAELTESSASLFQATAFRERESAEVIEIINMDHDYCGPAAGTSQSKDFVEDTENAPTMSATSLQENLVLSDEQKETDEDKKPVDADHNYCYNNPNSPSSNVEKEKESLPTPSSAITPSKKKQKSPKKKQKRSGSSSSSESSSNSDSSSCSCGTNCSCSSSSSSSSGSSSSSSDSDSSTSEGRRRQAARRERRRERAKKRKSEEISDTAPVQLEVADTANIGPAQQSEALALPIGPELEETELPIRESDLDTDETETDEDFYDKYPQKLANKLLAEKRNQLLLLAAVAPVNNGTMTQTGQSALTSSVEDQTTKRKVKTKKRKRSHLPHTNTVERVEQNLKMNIPSDYYTSQNPTFSKSSLTSTAMSPLHASSQSHPAVSHPDPSSLSTAYHSTGSGSETESKRASKRKRVPKRFYGDSSDEETEQQPAVKWRKVASTTSGSPLQTSMPASAFAYKSTPLMASEPRVPPAPTMEDKSEEEAGEDSDSDVRKSSSDSSNSESEAEKEDDASDGDSDADSVSVFQTNTSTSVKEGETGQQKNENLYCYCQCPYDEVSEMIACDGKDCTIEWFHFECVGIMVPPKGKWFCPDCRKRATSRSDYVPNV